MMKMDAKTLFPYPRLWIWILASSLFSGLMIRWCLMPLSTGDVEGPFLQWYAHFVQNGWAGLQNDPSNYTPLYSYLLLLARMTEPLLNSHQAVKLFPTLFDGVESLLAFAIVTRITGSRWKGSFAFAGLFLGPPFILNSSVGGQLESIWTSAILASVLFILRNNPKRAMACIGFGIAFKLQTVFFMPVVGLLWLRGRVSLKDLLLIPAVYPLACLPAFIAGRPWRDLINVYFAQFDYFHSLSMNAANIYQWLPKASYDQYAPAGILLAAQLCTLLVLWLHHAQKSQKSISGTDLIRYAVLLMLTVPLFLPKMHERYFYAADAIAVLYGCIVPSRWLVPLVMTGVSFLAYEPFFIGDVPVSFSILTLALVCTWIFLLRDAQSPVTVSPGEKP